jgi:hypothetical protein
MIGGKSMSDLISRQAAIDAIDDWRITVDDNRHPVDLIKALQPAQPEPDWTEITVVCDNCGHIIHVKRVNVLPLGRAEGR